VKRVLTGMLVCGLICLLGTTMALPQVSSLKLYNTPTEYEKLTGKKIEKFNEAPMLRRLVAAGELPPVEERLPKEPLVVKPMHKIGQYGGITRIVITGSESHDSFCARRQDMLFDIASDDLSKIVPHLAKGWDLSKDYKTITVYLREGVKWSDGYPFTADDILFWYKDIVLNDELTPVKPKKWAPAGKMVKIEKVNDYTVRFKFAVPYPRIIDILSNWGEPISCKHYLKKYHINYNPKANELAKEEGYDYWWQCFRFHAERGFAQRDVNLPSLDPWTLSHIDAAGSKYYKRNPYFWKIDTAGNQLPYIDEHMYSVVEDLETMNMKILSGEVSYAGNLVSIADYPLFKTNEEKGDYEVRLVKSLTASQCAFGFNYTHKDPVLRKIFNDIRFRQAASLAINRDEINRMVYYGKAIPYNCVVTPDCSFYEDWMGKYCIEYDPQKANALLDEMGLKWNKDHTCRLRPDGKPLSIIVEFTPYVPDMEKVLELVKEYWKAIGLKVTLKSEDRTFYAERMKANEGDTGGVWRMDGASEIYARREMPIRYRPPWHWPGLGMGGIEWYNWYNTGGKAGVEPPEEIKRLFKLVDEWLATPRGTEKYLELGKEILTINTKGLWVIHTVGCAPKMIVVKKQLKNTPPAGVIWDHDYQLWRLYRPEQWFWEKK